MPSLVQVNLMVAPVEKRKQSTSLAVTMKAMEVHPVARVAAASPRKAVEEEVPKAPVAEDAKELGQ
eukprot:8439494-Lingulodinium_polyedra.AAC.1